MLKILMMATTWTVIMNPEAQTKLIAQQLTFASSGYYSEQYPFPAELTDKATSQSYYSRKARGQNTVHKQ